jgi:hypothetical protein
MNRAELIAWAARHGNGAVTTKPDYQLSLSSKLVRFHWNGALTVAVGFDGDGKTRINATLDAVAMAISSPPTEGAVHLMLGTSAAGAADPSIREHLDAIGTLVAELRGGPHVRVWTINASEQPNEVDVAPPQFTTSTPARWTTLLMEAATTPPSGMASNVADALRTRSSFALYPKLSSLSSAQPWQMRLDGLEIGRTGSAGTTLRLASKDLTKPNEPRLSWQRVVGPNPLSFGPDRIDDVVAVVDELIAAWTDADHPDAVLTHGQAEHALEAHVLSGRLELTSASGPLWPSVPFHNGTLAAAQFPTLWGDVTRPARYLDALLADNDHRPWAVELKDQDAGGGHGAYLRHGIGQAVLYRHYIRTADALDPWFERHELNRSECQAALAFPTAAASTTTTIKRLRDLASLYDVELIEFARPL